MPLYACDYFIVSSKYILLRSFSICHVKLFWKSIKSVLINFDVTEFFSVTLGMIDCKCSRNYDENVSRIPLTNKNTILT